MGDISKRPSRYKSKLEDISKRPSRYKSKLEDISKRPSRYKSKREDISKRLSRYKSKWGTFPTDPLNMASLNGGHVLLFPLSVSLSLAPCLHLHFISISPPPSISIFLPSSLLFCFSFPSSASFLLPFLCSFFFLRKEILIILNESNRNASND